jgi:hypothetical protein
MYLTEVFADELLVRTVRELLGPEPFLLITNVESDNGIFISYTKEKHFYYTTRQNGPKENDCNLLSTLVIGWRLILLE